ncbi:tyrosine-type recombinase/integrase [Polynucleobacter paneuropaeus]|nr:tyrosine-type recombinase/integrase [Polynucleobacter paneuropaeus]
MPKIVKPMSALAVSKLATVGWHAVGGVSGLNLQIREPQNKSVDSPMPRSWVLRASIGAKRVPLGLGSYPQVSLADAREAAKKMSDAIRHGIDPRVQRNEARSALIASIAKNKTFKECAEAYMDAHAAAYTNDKHRKQWASTLKTYAYPNIGNMLVSDISMRNILDVLTQDVKDKKGKKLGDLWRIKTPTAQRLQGRLKTVLDYAIVNEYRKGTNPANWSGFLDTQLPSPTKIKPQKHHPAVPYAEVGDFMIQLRKNESISAKALEFLIHTAVRSGSVREAQWSEIDYEAKVWNIPASHTKTKEEHRVPLSDQAIKLLKSLTPDDECQFIFPSPNKVVLSDMALSEIMRGMLERGEIKEKAVPHGFRSTFRDWAAEQTAYPDEIRKAASGHVTGDDVKQAYQRTDLLEKRRKLMQEWSAFLGKPSIKKSGQVITMRKNA